MSTITKLLEFTLAFLNSKMEDVTSQEILAGYLDRPIESVMEEKELAKLVRKCTEQMVDENQINHLYATLSNAHSQSNWRQVDANLQELQFQSVWKDGDLTNSLKDDQIIKLSASLNGLNDSIIEEIKYLQNIYDQKMAELSIQVEELDETPLMKDPKLKLLEEVDSKLKLLENKLKH